MRLEEERSGLRCKTDISRMIETSKGEELWKGLNACCVYTHNVDVKLADDISQSLASRAALRVS